MTDPLFYCGYWIVVHPGMAEKGKVEHYGQPCCTVGDSIADSNIHGPIFYVHDHEDRTFLMANMRRAVTEVAKQQITQYARKAAS